ncbi:MotA/TolQ/ExbB proton channel family protein [Psychrobacter sp. FDAARGOS_221]|uniref:MotA/TolQ/ExbB proton channel family protein n=1 Tax=Psychrobacter sp. FDAARGOS_221 TaxID=1975705 RepID=UPI000BB556FD|nr:MotA/TolQ/ExbB proton channel family protein [Psychrobacter sp. FDAARGOS_221]PNK59827.1 MotA/TolQ/ExbB proton channel family protein [Psychrobacter sp. FDAARGOS_221]
MDFASYWHYTDIVTKFLFFTLIILSIASWVIGLLRIYYSRQQKDKVAAGLTEAVNSQKSSLENLSSAERKTVVEQVLMQQIGRLRFNSEKGMAVLGTTAAVAPFIGLFGTVWGIFHALHNIGETGQAGLGQVAGPVGEALIMTGLGLAVAIPAVIFYNIGIRINRKTLFAAHDVAYGLLGETAKVANADAASHSVKQTPSQATQSTMHKPSSQAPIESNSRLNTSTANR